MRGWGVRVENNGCCEAEVLVSEGGTVVCEGSPGVVVLGGSVAAGVSLGFCESKGVRGCGDGRENVCVVRQGGPQVGEPGCPPSRGTRRP